VSIFLAAQIDFASHFLLTVLDSNRIQVLFDSVDLT
jgi:hypothetical protein